MDDKENKKRLRSSSEELAEYLQQCDADVIYAMIKILRSRLHRASFQLAENYYSVDDIPAPRTTLRTELIQEIIKLLGWYGSNAVAYTWRRFSKGKGGKSYLGILQDVAKLFNKRLPKKDRKKLPITAGVADFETILAEIMVTLRFHKKKPEEILQILEEAGIEKHVAEEVAKKYAPTGFAGISLPMLTKLLGKKTVMNVVQLLAVSIVGKFVGKETASQMVKRMALKITQKALTRTISWIGWIILAVDIIGFCISPARRITTKAVPLIALVRVGERLKKGENL